jgi:hypothetical protein
VVVLAGPGILIVPELSALLRERLGTAGSAVEICLSIFAIIGFAMRVVVESRIYDAHVITAEMRIQQALGVMGQAGLALCVVTPKGPLRHTFDYRP